MGTRILLGLCAVVASLAVASPAMGHYSHRSGARCGAIAGAPQTDEGVSDIRASGTGCRTARAVARGYLRGETRPSGFTCRRRAHDPSNGLAHSDVRCRRGERLVTFGRF